MDKKYMLFICGCIGALFILLWLQGDITFHLGKEVQSGGEHTTVDTTVEGALWISPYGVENELLDLLSETAYSVDIWMYQLTSKEVLGVLKNLGYLGVDIDMVLENNPFGGSSKEYDAVVQQLSPVGAAIVTDDPLGTNFVHAKTILLDDTRYIISTANLGYTSFWKNREYWFVGEQPAIAESLRTLFLKDHVAEPVTPSDIHPALLLCPVDCREKITAQLWEATKSIVIEAQYIQDASLVAVLRKKQMEGLDVRMIVGEYQDAGRLETFGTGVKMMDAYYLHAKNILIDGEQLLMGSMNLSTNALDNNREIGIIIDDEEVVQLFSGQFERDWEEADYFLQ